jgi:2-oxo-4-hydroxy-4-carboxy-5-ureidoimidazoline decarboxylase
MDEEGGNMPAEPLSLSALNALDRERFVAALATLFEGPPWIVEELWARRPFASVPELYAAAYANMWAAPEWQQLELLRAHPDLVGRAALAGTLSRPSTAEQSAAGLDRLTADEINVFTRSNAAYRERFGFPFIVCARENTKGTILDGFAARLPNTREHEIATALGEVAKIAALRLRDLVSDDSPSA